MEGWIKLHRNIMEHWLYNDNTSFTKREVWFDLILNANHTTKEILIGNQVFLCKRGQSIRSIASYGKRYNWTNSKVVRFLKLLEKQQMIEKESIKKAIRITICNYDKYQGLRNDAETLERFTGKTNDTLAKPNKTVNQESEGKRKAYLDNADSNTTIKKDPFYGEL